MYIATLSDIAQLASVSASTVSRVLSDHPHINETTRTKVLQAANDLGYLRGNLRSTSQVLRSVLLMGMGSPSPSHEGDHPHEMSTEFARQVLGGVQAFYEQRGIAVRLQNSQNSLSSSKQNQYPTKSKAQNYADDPSLVGLILLGGEIDHDFVRDLQSNNVSFVIVGGHPHSSHANCIVADYRNGLEQAVSHLVEAGRTCIGLVNGPPTTVTSEEKYKGFRLALSLHNLNFVPDQLVAGKFTPKEGYEQTHCLIKQMPNLDAIIYGDDYMALGGVHALKESGRQVPDDVAIVGFHNYGMAEFTDPPLTSVRFDMRRMGMIAARRLSMLLEDPGDDEPWSILEPTSLVVRKSSWTSQEKEVDN